jgi:hypothetical protein
MTELTELSYTWLEAVCTRLNGDAPLQALITGTYVHALEASQPPYLLISPPRLQERHSRSITVAQGEAVFTLWSDIASVAEAHTILQRVEIVLSATPLMLSTHHVVVMRVLEMQCRRTQQRDLAGSMLRCGLWMEGV